MSDNMTLNRLPSLTWNRLQVNGAPLRNVPDAITAVEKDFQNLPDGITTKELSFEEAQNWLAQNAPKEEAEAVVAGKQPIYHPQKFGTGLGEDADLLLAKAEGTVTLLDIKDGVSGLEPLRWNIVFHSGNKAQSAQIIHVGKGSELTLVINWSSEKDSAVKETESFAMVSTKVVLEAGAKLTLARTQMLDQDFTALDDVGAALEENAQMTLIQMSLGAKNSYLGVQSELIGKNASFDVKTGYLAKKGQLVDINYNTIQRGKKTNCQMSFDGVLDDDAVKTFRGTIDFRKGSKGAVGNEQENVLLLSDDVVNKTLPIILCEEEDVEGRHGASIGQLDQDMLFYMAARGIDEKAAEQIMVRARLGAVAREIPDKALREDVHEYIEKAFHG